MKIREPLKYVKLENGNIIDTTPEKDVIGVIKSDYVIIDDVLYLQNYNYGHIENRKYAQGKVIDECDEFITEKGEHND
jgi:hypothetical protein